MGLKELRSPEEVDAVLGTRSGSVLVLVNSVCKCAARSARPGLAESLHHPKRPDEVVTVFAGVDVEATSRVRSYFPDQPPTSPQIALFREGRLVHLLQREDIEGAPPEEIAEILRDAYDRYCGVAA